MSEVTKEEPSQADRSNSNASSIEVDEECIDAVPNNANSTVPAPSNKTISCVSCRKRKLKCDRIKPRCGTCTRLRHECEFPERKRNLGSKRRNMKELEARLAQVETQLVTETKQSAHIEPLSTFNTTPNWDAMNLDMDMGSTRGPNDPFDNSTDLFALPKDPINPNGDFFSQELLALGLQEPLPTQDIMDELTAIYFATVHKNTPIMHKYRFYASLDRAPHMRPPVCLRYAMWTVAASITDKYLGFEDILYERTRRYLQQDEMKGHGGAFVTVYHVQAWAIIGIYEATKTYFSRSWMSSGRSVRLCHMLGLHRLDVDGSDIKRILPPPKDWIELEERRRTFWIAFYVDRWASSGTGWPMIIDESEILTSLPSSEDSFENGVMQSSISLADALSPEGASNVSPFGGIILSATLFGHNFQHLHKVGVNERPQDVVNGEFWKRHRKMDNVLSNTFMFLPDHLRLPAGLRDSNIPLIHMNIHASVICLHQAAILTAEKHKLSLDLRRQCRDRSYMAAEEIVNIMKMISHFDVALLSSWTGFCLYVAAGVLVQDKKLDPSRVATLHNLDFLLSAMRALGKRHSITNHFTAQLELDIEASGIRNPAAMPSEPTPIKRGMMTGILQDRPSAPKSFADFRDYSNDKYQICNDASPKNQEQRERLHRLQPTPMTILPASSRTPGDPPEDLPYEMGVGCPSFPAQLHSEFGKQSQTSAFSSDSSSGYTGSTAYPTGVSSDTPPTDQSTPVNNMQYPIRLVQSEEVLENPIDWHMFATNSATFQVPAHIYSKDIPGASFPDATPQDKNPGDVEDYQLWSYDGQG